MLGYRESTKKWTKQAGKRTALDVKVVRRMHRFFREHLTVRTCFAMYGRSVLELLQ